MSLSRILLIPEVLWNGFFFQAVSRTVGFFHEIQQKQSHDDKH